MRVVLQRKNKGLAWAWLKSAVADEIGKKKANALFDKYFRLLNEEYRDRRRLAAVGELEVLYARLEAARADDLPSVVRRIEKMIAVREAWLSE